jgi:hypothetical protein
MPKGTFPERRQRLPVGIRLLPERPPGQCAHGAHGAAGYTQYMATMEAAYRAKEDKLFYNIPLTSYPKASGTWWLSYRQYHQPNDSLARVNGSGNKVGPALVLKVMSGDKVDIAVKVFYRGQWLPASTADPLADILTSLAAGIGRNCRRKQGSFISRSIMATVRCWAH